MFNLKDIISALTGHETAAVDQELTTAVIDSRQAVTNSLFIALPGAQVDGHDYVQAAFNNGAVVALVDKELHEDLHILDLREGYFHPDNIDATLPVCLRVNNSLSALQSCAAYWRSKHAIRTIGITGSVGKTSTKELTAALLAQKYHVLKNPGNRNNEIGLPLTLLDLNEHHQYAVLEMGFYVRGEIRTLCQIAHPHVGVVTNVGTVHAERAGSQEMIAKGKAELVESLPDAPEGVAILNMDDQWVREMSKKTRAQIFSYAIENEASLTASDIKSHGLDGISCTLTHQGKSHSVHSPLLGEFSVYTILRATAVALTEDLPWDLIEAGLSTSQVNLRMQQITLPNNVVVLDDTYNASPASTIAALQLLKGLKGRRVAILGDMLELGPYEATGHQEVGEFAACAADVLILVGERSKIIAKAAVQNGFPDKYVAWYPSSELAAQPAANTVQKGDVVLIKGSNSIRMEKIMTALKEAV